MNSLKYTIHKINYIMNEKKFRFIILSLIGLNLYGILNVPSSLSYAEALLYIFSNIWYVSILLFIIYLSSFNIYEKLEKNSFYKIRFCTKMKYNKEIIKNILIINTLVLLINLGLCCIGLNIKTSPIHSLYYYYSIPFFVYDVFHIIKITIFMHLFSIMGFSLWQYMNKTFAFMLMGMIDFSMLFWNYNVATIASFQNMHWFYGYYMTYLPYSSFMLEISISFLYIWIMAGITLLLFNITTKKRGYIE